MGFFARLIGTDTILKGIKDFRKTFAFWSIQWSLPNTVIWHLTESFSRYDEFWPTGRYAYEKFKSYDFEEFFVFCLLPIVLLFSFTLHDIST